MSPIKLLYLEDFSLLTAPGVVVDVAGENGRDVVLLDRTVFYPPGGGQPYDQGVITTPSSTFFVEEVRFADGLVKHIGKFENGKFTAGDAVSSTANADRRALHSQLHSAGHVVDMAVLALDLGWVPGKGYHFPDGPYVEYRGDLGTQDREVLKKAIEQKCLEFIAEDRPTTLRFMDKSEMLEVCHFVSDDLPTGKPTCVVFYGDFGIPCGGTHVSRLSAIGQMTIRKFKPSGGTIRVAYDVPR